MLEYCINYKKLNLISDTSPFGFSNKISRSDQAILNPAHIILILVFDGDIYLFLLLFVT